MNRKIIFHGEYFLDFYKSLDAKVKSKIQYVFEERRNCKGHATEE